MQISKDIRELIEVLQRHHVVFAVCGGHAVAFHGHPRMTMDVDLLVLPSPANADRLISALDEFGFGKTGIPREAFLNPGTATTLGVQPNQVDLLTSMSSTPTPDIISRGIPGKLADIEVIFVSRQDLIDAKREAGRPKDLADLEELNS